MRFREATKSFFDPFKNLPSCMLIYPKNRTENLKMSILLNVVYNITLDRAYLLMKSELG